MPSERRRKGALHCRMSGGISYYLSSKAGHQEQERESRTIAGLLSDATRRFWNNIPINQFTSGMNEMSFST